MTYRVRRMASAALLGATLALPLLPATAQTPPHDHAAMQRAAAVPTTPRDFTEADVAFMQGMIPHHAQALEMTALVEARTQSRALRLLAERIEVSQRDEIAWMQQWLRDRGQTVPEAVGTHAMHGDAHHAMPGMLTPEQMADLAAATGTDFEQKFLDYMIRHHEGAITMVAALFASPGAAQTSAVYHYATDVDADQRADIRRMQAMLFFLPTAAPPPAPSGHRHH